MRSVHQPPHVHAEPQCRYLFRAPGAEPDGHRLVQQVLFDVLPGPDLASVRVHDGARTVFELDTLYYGGCRQLSAGEAMQAMAVYSQDFRARIPLLHEKVRLGLITVSLDIHASAACPLKTQVMVLVD